MFLLSISINFCVTFVRYLLMIKVRCHLYSINFLLVFWIDSRQNVYIPEDETIYTNIDMQHRSESLIKCNYNVGNENEFCFFFFQRIYGYTYCTDEMKLILAFKLSTSYKQIEL